MAKKAKKAKKAKAKKAKKAKKKWISARVDRSVPPGPQLRVNFGEWRAAGPPFWFWIYPSSSLP